ncbi:MAG: AI-2E family transporter [Deltaproteobacteria bacterium]|jgi:predicted PurR-regulated permease PerM|nr:AI-2E family transporter [Deltaproteobacteria bacterium]MBW2534897.1 AI-2E family transporter [Deltaproteobacteria bacterium]
MVNPRSASALSPPAAPLYIGHRCVGGSSMLERVIQKYKLDKQASIYRLLLLFTVIVFLAASFALSSLLKPFILALFIAYGLNPIVDKLERRGVNSVLAILITLVGILVLLAAMVYFLYANVTSFLESKRLDEYIAKFDALYANGKQQVVAWGLVDPDQGLGQDTLQRAIAAGKSTLIGAVTQTTNFLSQSFLFIFYLVLLLPGIKNFRVKVYRAFEKRKAAKINAINDNILTQVQEYISQKTLLSLGTGAAVYVLCLFFGIDLALVWAVLTFVLNFIPNIGSLIASIFPIVIAILQPGTSTVEVVAFAAGVVAVQFLIGNVVEPKVFSGKFSLSTLVVFGGLVFWGWLWGMVGVILSVPIMVIISILCRNIPALRPIGIFLQSSFPVREDEERLSLIAHIAYADKKLQEDERRHIEAELQKDIYDPDSIRKVWQKIEKKPLPLEDIFRDKAPADKLALYELACRIALLNDDDESEEQKILAKIQRLAELSPTAVRNVHHLLTLQDDSAAGDGLVVAKGLSDDGRDEQIAHSFKMLARKHFEAADLDAARDAYQQALRRFILLEESHEILDCSGSLSLMDSLAET